MQSRLKWSDEHREQAVRDYFVELHRRFTVFDQQTGAPQQPEQAIPRRA